MEETGLPKKLTSWIANMTQNLEMKVLVGRLLGVSQ